MNKKIWIGLVILIIGLAVGTYFYLGKNSGKKGAKEVSVVRGDLSVSILATGVVQPEKRVEIKPPINGRMEEVLVKEGDKVKKGQILAWMSSTERAALLDAARAKGKRVLKEWEAMYQGTPIIAPITGEIILRKVESGQSFTSQDAVLVMSDRLTVKANVDETDIAQIQLQLKARIVLDAYPDKTLPAKVDQIAHDAVTVSNVTSYVVDVLPDETPTYLRSGMTANVTFDIDSRTNVLLIPSEAIRAQGGTAVAQVKDANGKAEERVIKLGKSDGKLTEIIEGLVENEIVLVPRFQMGEGKNKSSNPLTPGGTQRRKGH